MSHLNVINLVKRKAKTLKKHETTKSHCNLLDEVTRQETNFKNFHDLTARVKSRQPLSPEEITQNQILMVLAKDQDLNYFGLGLLDHGRGLTWQQRANELSKGRKDLMNSHNEFIKACKWFETQKKIKTFNYKRNSYGLKHQAESAMGTYISNGVIIAAAVHMGFKYKRINFGPNAHFNISQVTLRMR